MGRLLAIGLAVAAAGIAIIVVNGPGLDKPEEPAADVPERQATTVSESAPAESIAATGETKVRAPTGATVVMRRLDFRPSAVSVDPGEAVRFVNRDSVAHTVVEDVGARSGLRPAIDSRRIAPGRTLVFVPETPGAIPYICTLHPTVMAGRIVVEKPAS